MHAQSENDCHSRTTNAAGIIRAALRLRGEKYIRAVFPSFSLAKETLKCILKSNALCNPVLK